MTVSRYVKGVTLGEGTYGVVYKALDQEVRAELPATAIKRPLCFNCLH